jgi:hypothetical protein
MNSGAKHLQAPMYQKAGVVGEMAGNVQSFGHNTLTQLAYDLKSVKNGDTGAKRALATKLGLQLAVGGMVGMYGVQEINTLWNLVKQASNDPDIIDTAGPKEYIMATMPEAWSMGPLSSKTGVDFSGTFGAPQMTSDNLMSTVWPLGSQAANMAQGAYKFGKGVVTGNRANVIGGLQMAAPDLPGFKGKFERMLSTEDANGNLHVERPNIDYKKKTTRTPEEQSLREMGLTGIHESMDRKMFYESQRDETLRKGAQDVIIKKIPEAFADVTINKNLGNEWKSELYDMQLKYVKLGGDPKKFVAEAIRAAQGRAAPNEMIAALRIKGKDIASVKKNNRVIDNFNKMHDNFEK